MKCPLRYNVWVDKENKPILLDQDCLKEECAWWDDTNGRCAVLQFSKSIFYMGIELAQMEIKMPHVEQFKRP